MTITEIQNFLYEIDSILSDEQINTLAEEIFDNQEILIELLNNERRSK
tara:strand:+ start:159 stop:302 length:144 start_codon:yes stop_codon:yes gene_type:complete